MREVDVYIIRHGETNENAQRIIQGQMNTQLNQTGREQAEIVAIALKDVKFTHAYTSDLSRASEVRQISLLSMRTGRLGGSDALDQVLMWESFTFGFSSPTFPT